MTDMKKIAGFRRVWTADGNIFTFDRNGKIFNVKTHEDLKRVKPEEDTRVGHRILFMHLILKCFLVKSLIGFYLLSVIFKKNV